MRYDNNGGLNPVSPEKRGLGGLEMTTGTVSMNPNRELRNSSTVKMARPSLDLDISQRAVSVFQPRKIISDSEASKRFFKKYSAFR